MALVRFCGGSGRATSQFYPEKVRRIQKLRDLMTMNKNMTFVFLGYLALCWLIYPPNPTFAGEPTERVRDMLERVMSVQNDPGLQGKESEPRRKAAIQEIIGVSFDFDYMVESALGPHWGPLNAEQRTAFKGLFRELFEDSYTKLVLDFIRREKIQYNGEEMPPEGAMVKTVMFRPQEQISVDYLLARAKGGGLVRDVRIDGVSIVENYKRSFERVIARDSFNGLMERLRLQRRTIEKTP
jgi:phospholipid transport system substrate-binding protein